MSSTPLCPGVQSPAAIAEVTQHIRPLPPIVVRMPWHVSRSWRRRGPRKHYCPRPADDEAPTLCSWESKRGRGATAPPAQTHGPDRATASHPTVAHAPGQHESNAIRVPSDVFHSTVSRGSEVSGYSRGDAAYPPPGDHRRSHAVARIASMASTRALEALLSKTRKRRSPDPL